MKCCSVIAFLFAFVAMLVSAVPHTETNAARMARGLGPKAPVRRSPSRVNVAARSRPSILPPVCPIGTLLNCCTGTKKVLGIPFGEGCTFLSDSDFRAGKCSPKLPECCGIFGCSPP